jgi:hypothetical protein
MKIKLAERRSLSAKEAAKPLNLLSAKEAAKPLNLLSAKEAAKPLNLKAQTGKDETHGAWQECLSYLISGLISGFGLRSADK